MEELYPGYPEISELIYVNLDNKSLVYCRLVCKNLKNSIDNGKILWRRMLEKYIENLDTESWKKVLDKIPLEIVKDMATATVLYNTFMQNAVEFPENILHPHNSKFKPASTSDKNEMTSLHF